MSIPEEELNPQYPVTGGPFGSAGPFFGGPTSMPAPGFAPVEPAEPVSETSRAVAAAAGITSWKGEAEAQFRQLGADMGSYQVQAILEIIDSSSDEYNTNPESFQVDMLGFTSNLQQQGIIPVPEYTQVSQLSGFGTDLEPFFPLPEGFSIELFGEKYELDVPEFRVHPTTGWIQYRSGVMVDPNAPLGEMSGVYFPADSTAPGSRNWMQQIQTGTTAWSPEKVNEWRGKLVDDGYLDPSFKKGPMDVNFLNALQRYQYVKYQNNGKPVPLDQSASGGLPAFNFEQVQAQVRNDVRDQYRRIYGDLPTDTELQEWQDFIISTSRRLYQKGQLSPMQATVEAEERFIERLEQAPEAQFVMQNLEENTKMRDDILRAVMVSQAMVG